MSCSGRGRRKRWGLAAEPPTSVSENWLVIVQRQSDGSWKIARGIWTQELQSAKTK
jgi:ketosteroid isomerase-like protein